MESPFRYPTPDEIQTAERVRVKGEVQCGIVLGRDNGTVRVLWGSIDRMAVWADYQAEELEPWEG